MRPAHSTIGATVLLAFALLASSCGPASSPGKGTAAPAPAAIQVSLEPVSRREVPRFIEVSGSLFGVEETQISTRLGGPVDSILKDLGDIVLPGEALARIDAREHELTLAQSRASLLAALARVGLDDLPGDDFDLGSVPTVVSARAEAANAQARYERGRQLFEGSTPMISAQDFADLRTAAEVAAHAVDVAILNARSALADARTRAAEVAVAEKLVDDATIRAPGPAGASAPRYQVASRAIALGEYVSVGQTMFRLVASDTVQFRASIPERYAGQVRTGQPADARVDAYDDDFHGSVARVSPSIDPASRAFEVEIEVPNADGRLKPGAFARGRIVTHAEKDVAFVPEAALVTFAGIQKVFTVKDDKAVEHRVRAGVRESGLVEIVGGIDAQMVVTTGAASLSNNAPVRVLTP